jgi:hypothetical protein
MRDRIQKVDIDSGIPQNTTQPEIWTYKNAQINQPEC